MGSIFQSVLPINLPMKAQSFREILSQFLEENPGRDAGKPNAVKESTLTKVSSIYDLPLTFARPQAASHFQKTFPYGKPKPRKAHTPLKPTIEVEEIFALSTLSEGERTHLEAFLKLGASEFHSGISEKRLKRSFRRLAKCLHPDISHCDSAHFRSLQSAKEGLSQALNRLGKTTSSKPCDSEFASEPRCPRRDAA